MVSAKVEKGGPYHVILANQIAGKPVRISCHIVITFSILSIKYIETQPNQIIALGD